MPNILDFIKDLLNFLSKTFGEEIANQTSAEIDVLKKKHFEVKEDVVDGGAPVPKLSDTPEFQELLKKYNDLEKTAQDLRFNEFFKTQADAGRLVPSQKEIIKVVFNTFTKQQGLQFSDGVKSGDDFVKALINSFPKQVEFSEIAKNGTTADNFDLQNKVIDEFNKSKKI